MFVGTVWNYEMAFQTAANIINLTLVWAHCRCFLLHIYAFPSVSLTDIYSAFCLSFQTDIWIGFSQACTSGHCNFTPFLQLQNCSSSVRLHGDRVWTAHFKSSHKFSIGQRSGLWLQNIHLVVFKPFLRSFCCMRRVIVLLENKSSPKSYFSCRWNQIVLQDFPICCIHFTPYLYKPSRACCREASPQHDAATTMLHGGNAMLVMMWRLVWWAKSAIVVSSDHGNSFQLTSESPTRLLGKPGTPLEWS